MTEPRLKTALRVSAMLRTADGTGRPGMLLRRGDPDAGGIVVVLRGRSGLSALTGACDDAGDPCWIRATGPDPLTQPDLDAWLERQLDRDPDLWIVELEAPGPMPPFEAKPSG